MTGALVLLATLAAATVLAVVLRGGTARTVREGARRRLPPGTASALGVPVDGSARAVLLQFSSRACAPCRTTRRVLQDVVRHDVTTRDVAAQGGGVVHVEVDAEDHLEHADALGVRRTPTVLVLDGSGEEQVRWSGAARRAEVDAALRRVA